LIAFPEWSFCIFDNNFHNFSLNAFALEKLLQPEKLCTQNKLNALLVLKFLRKFFSGKLKIKFILAKRLRSANEEEMQFL